jgi:hypothetical protein
MGAMWLVKELLDRVGAGTRGPGAVACADCPPVSRPSGFASVPVADVVLVGT